MSQKKRIIILTLLVLTLFIVLPANAMAADNAVISVGSTTSAVTAGNTITIPVTISGNPGIAAYGLTVIYDSDNLTLTAITNTSGLCNTGTFNTNIENDGIAYVSWLTGSSADMTDNGVLFYLNFTVNANAKSGNYTISCALTNSADSNFINYAEQNVAVSFTNGVVKVAISSGGAVAGENDTDSNSDDQSDTETNANHFGDITSSYWAYSYVEYLASLGIINGKSGNQYCPADNITRAEFVTILARMSGERLPAYNGIFGDVNSDAYYAQPVAWAVAADVTNGTSATKFSCNNNITREDMAVMIYRYAAYKGYDFNIVNAAVNFSDETDIDTYALTAVNTMQQADIINGYNDGSFNPLGFASRAEAAKMLALLYQAMI